MSQGSSFVAEGWKNRCLKYWNVAFAIEICLAEKVSKIE